MMTNNPNQLFKLGRERKRDLLEEAETGRADNAALRVQAALSIEGVK